MTLLTLTAPSFFPARHRLALSHRSLALLVSLAVLGCQERRQGQGIGGTHAERSSDSGVGSSGSSAENPNATEAAQETEGTGADAGAEDVREDSDNSPDLAEPSAEPEPQAADDLLENPSTSDDAAAAPTDDEDTQVDDAPLAGLMLQTPDLVTTPDPSEGSGGAGAEADAEPDASGGASDGLEPSAAPAATGTSVVGTACEDDTDCSPGLSCVVENEFFGGIIAGGICTAECSNLPESCALLDPASGCIGSTDRGSYCLEICQVGDGSAKCGRRLNQTCIPLDQATLIGACLPNCFDDLECPAGTSCNPASGLCTEEPLDGTAFAAACSEDADCLGGICLLVTDSSGVCSGLCTVTGLIGGCGYDPDGAAPPPALCYPALDESQLGDPGFCNPTCDTDADCLYEELECVPFADEETATTVGRLGTCGPNGTTEQL